MLIKTQFVPSGELQVDANTYSIHEFTALENALDLAGIQAIFYQLPADYANRESRRYTVPSNQVTLLEAVLEGTFQSNGQFVPRAGTGNKYACREITLRGSGSGCEDLVAPNDSVAQVKCALIARTNNWFGGVPNMGICP